MHLSKNQLGPFSLPRMRAVIARWPMAPVVVVYMASALVIPIETVAAPADEWIYVRAIERLSDNGILEVPDPAAMNLIFHTVWGALSAEIFGLSFAVLRSASAVLMIASALGLYRLCREVKVPAKSAVLAASAYLFNPLAVVLGWSTMTDATFTALIVLATWAFIESQRRDFPALWVILGSLFSSAAFLVRQIGVLVPIAFLAWVLTVPRLRRPRSIARLSAMTMGPLIVIVGAFSWWLTNVNGVPEAQRASLDLILRASVADWVVLLAGVGIVALGWCGFFVLPLAFGAWEKRFQQISDSNRGTTIAAAMIALLVCGSVAFFAALGRLMPYAASWLNGRGVGPDDVVGGRHTVVSGWHQVTLTLIVAAAVWAVLTRVWAMRQDINHLILWVALGQFVGAVVVSMPFRTVPSLDRYMLPLLPLVLVVSATVIRLSRRAIVVGFLVVAAFGVLGVGWTRDWLSFQDAVWRTADEAVANGAEIDSVDAGAGWTGYHLYEYSRAQGQHNADPDAPAWIRLWDLGTSRCHIVSTVHIDGFRVVSERSFSQWLGRDGRVVLLRGCDG